MKKDKMLTSYGYRFLSDRSCFILVAPHRTGDDPRAGHVARRVSENIGASCIVNTKYAKHINLRGLPVEDFNRLYWDSGSGKYLWKMSNKHTAMKLFWGDINRAIKNIRKLDQVPIVIHVHGMRCDDSATDIGAGYVGEGCDPSQLRIKKTGRRLGASGIETCDKDVVGDFQDHLQESFSMYNLPLTDVTVGCYYPANSRRTGIQYHKHKHPDIEVLQIEISHILRRKENVQATIDALTDAIKKTFQ